MIGERFGRLTVLGEIPVRTKDRRIKYACVCDCGELVATSGRLLKSGKTTSCGCVIAEAVREGGLKRRTVKEWAFKDHPLYRTWSGMRTRCYNPNHTYYKYYGGKGVGICDRWKESFLSFVEDMGERPEGYTLDRIDSSGDYCPENCRWASWDTQGENKSNVLLIEYRGEKRTLKDWSKVLGINYSTLWFRLNRRNQTTEEAFSSG